MSGEYKKFIREKVAASKGITFFERPLKSLSQRELIAAIVVLSDELDQENEQLELVRSLLRGRPLTR
jgi:hypothetical protein